MKKLLLFLLLPALCLGGLPFSATSVIDSAYAIRVGVCPFTGTTGSIVVIFKPVVTGATGYFLVASDTLTPSSIFSFGIASDSVRLVSRIAGGTNNIIFGQIKVVAKASYISAVTSNGSAWSIFTGLLGFNVRAESLRVTGGTNTGDWFGDFPEPASVGSLDNVSVNSIQRTTLLSGTAIDYYKILVYNRQLVNTEINTISSTLGVVYPLMGLKAAWIFDGPINARTTSGTILKDFSGNGINLNMRCGVSGTRAAFPYWSGGLPFGFPKGDK